MSVPQYVSFTARESAYVAELTRQCSSICSNIDNAKRRPPKSNSESWGCLIILGIIISFIPSCTISLVMSGGEIGTFLILTILGSIGMGFGLAYSIKESSRKEHSEWTPKIGEKQAKDIALKNNFKEKQYLLSVFNSIAEYDRQLDKATNSGKIIELKNKTNLFKRKLLSAYKEISREEKSKSTKRYSKSVMYNRLLDGNYSASDHVRATKRIQAQEQSRLEGFVIA